MPALLPSSTSSASTAALTRPRAATRRCFDAPSADDGCGPHQKRSRHREFAGGTDRRPRPRH
eukprot:5250782-Pyramimonas_sp.AAC.1